MSAFENIRFKKHSTNAFIFFTIATILFGIIYPFFITFIGHTFFSYQVNGSIVKDNSNNGNIVGSELIGQSFDNPKYFWGRLSATPGFPYNANASSGSNLAPSNSLLIDQVSQRIIDLRKYDSNNTAPIPVDLVTASASGLDPDISVAAAYYQADRVARYQNVSVRTIEQLIVKYTQSGDFIFLGERRVNVLDINLELKNGIDYNSLPKNNSTVDSFSFLGNRILNSLNIRTVDAIKIIVYFIVLFLLAIPLGKFMTKLFMEHDEKERDPIKLFLF